MENNNNLEAKALGKVYHTAAVLCEYLNCILKKVTDKDLTREITHIVMKTCEFSDKASNEIHRLGEVPEELSKMKKNAITTATAINTMFGTSLGGLCDLIAVELKKAECELRDIKNTDIRFSDRFYAIVGDFAEFCAVSRESVSAFS